MIKKLNLKKLSCFPQLVCKRDVSLACRKISGRMVVSDNDTAGVAFQRCAEDETWVSDGSGCRTCRKIKKADDQVGSVQQQ